LFGLYFWAPWKIKTFPILVVGAVQIFKNPKGSFLWLRDLENVQSLLKILQKLFIRHFMTSNKIK
jgi:hypothetical protein